jgi:SAM-dependent methyltransferase
MGESSPAHFTWLSSAIREHRHLFGRLARPSTVFAIGEQRETPPIRELVNVLGGRATVRLFDLSPSSAAVERLDVNRLDGLPSRACEIITLVRTSVFIRDPAHVLAGFHRVLRPGGIVVVDWLHGHSDKPVLDLGPGDLYVTTYLDDELLRLPAFGALVEHVSRPPRWRHLARALLRRVRHPSLPPLPRLDKGRHVDLQGYPQALRRALEEAGKNLVVEKNLAPWFAVRARAARYFYPETRTFACWALTLLERQGAP